MEDLCRVSSVFTVNDRLSLPNFEAIAAGVEGSALYLPTAYDRDVHVPVEAGRFQEDGKFSDVFFCGTGFDERARLFAQADWSGIDFALTGFWPESEQASVIPDQVEARLGQISIGYDKRLKPFLRGGLQDNRDLAQWYRQTKVVLSVHRDYPGAQAVGPRVYEAAAIGAFQVCDDSRPELVDLFGDTVATFPAGDEGEMLGVIRYYLDRPKMRAEMANAARERVLGHSYDDRLTTLVNHIYPARSG